MKKLILILATFIFVGCGTTSTHSQSMIEYDDMYYDDCNSCHYSSGINIIISMDLTHRWYYKKHNIWYRMFRPHIHKHYTHYRYFYRNTPMLRPHRYKYDNNFNFNNGKYKKYEKQRKQFQNKNNKSILRNDGKKYNNKPKINTPKRERKFENKIRNYSKPNIKNKTKRK